MQIDIDAFEYAIGKIDDGYIFEDFAQSFLSGLIGYEYVPIGGSKDKGIDGLLHTFFLKSDIKTVIQISTEGNYQNKICKTILKLIENKISFDRLRFVSNRNIPDIDKICELVYKEYKKSLVINDIKWFKANCNSNESVINSYRTFSSKYLFEYNSPGKVKFIANLDEDSRLYVFLRQQFDLERKDIDIDDLLVDTLILFALENTDPEKKVYLKKDEILINISKYIKFDIRLLSEKIDNRLIVLAKKPRKINFHPRETAYCLPFETRLEIQKRNLLDTKLMESFFTETETTIKRRFKESDVLVKNVSDLLSLIINRIFLKQGLEFSNFVLSGDSSSIFEQNLEEVISLAIDESSVVQGNKEKIKDLLIITIREIVYNGSDIQNRYLKSLSRTYLMMFMLHWEPKISTYFHSLASQLKIFVDNSIIIPALSEYYLENTNRRHWNLLLGAKNAGISMFINDTLLHELITHIKMVKTKYETFFKETEDFYLNDECEYLFIDEILIRAYFYAKKRNHVKSFDSFLDNFLDPGMEHVKDALVEYLKDVFGIIHASNESWDIKIDPKEKDKLFAELKGIKRNSNKAANDAEMILSIYYLRSMGNETSSSGIFGYKTWWLSKDTNTFKAVTKVFGGTKYEISCYIRPDFIYNYIALMPSLAEINKAYQELFPTMLGVNLSYHMPQEVSSTVQRKMLEFRDKPPIRVRQILKELSNKIKSDASLKTKYAVESYLDAELKKITSVK